MRRMSLGFVVLSVIAVVGFLGFVSTRTEHIPGAQRPHHVLHGFKDHVDALLKDIGLP